MNSRWIITVNKRYLEALYRLPRGVAGEVTDAIETLQNDPTPVQAETVEGRANTYRLTIADHLIEYEVVSEKRIIKLLSVT